MNKTYILNHLGFKESFEEQAKAHPNLYPGRIIEQARDKYRVATHFGETIAEVSGKFRYEALEAADFPAVGDFVLLDRPTEDAGTAQIQQCLTRQSALIRKAAGTTHERQIIAANVDKVFICMSLNEDFNLRRAERYLALVWDSGAVPTFVLTKTDIAQDLEKKLEDLQQISLGVDILMTSAYDEDSYLSLREYIKQEETVVLVGSSGVGKSTLINGLLAKQKLKTNGLRHDGKGRHTTTQRQLFKLPSGGMIIDTPGLREVGLEQANFSETFSDIVELASCCKFSDCSHGNEPGCAVQEAIEQGQLSQERFSNYQKLIKEAGYDGMNAKEIERRKLDTMFKEVGGMKNARKFLKKKDKRVY
ncbi:ribosome small subunit-dependent GTPase A [Lactococcus ileimucosae]|uniref:ribosome small subunit-dependent GTPase A n=1 Tax=Lactococcus ileimucosae TaxID=2941329 RepID=UPI00351816AC